MTSGSSLRKFLSKIEKKSFEKSQLESWEDEKRTFLQCFYHRLRIFLTSYCPDVLWIYDLHLRKYDVAEKTLMNDEKRENVSYKRSMTLLTLSELCWRVEEEREKEREREREGERNGEKEREMERGDMRVDPIEKDERRRRKREIKIQLRLLQKSLLEKIERFQNEKTERNQSRELTNLEENGKVEIDIESLKIPLTPFDLSKAFVDSCVFFDHVESRFIVLLTYILFNVIFNANQFYKKNIL